MRAWLVNTSAKGRRLEHWTQEQMAAAKELATAAQAYRVVADAEGWPVSPGRYGRLEHLAGLAGPAVAAQAFKVACQEARPSAAV